MHERCRLARILRWAGLLALLAFVGCATSTIARNKVLAPAPIGDLDGGGGAAAPNVAPAAEASKEGAYKAAHAMYKVGDDLRRSNHLEDALTAYRRALELLGDAAHPDLRAAILNSQGITYRFLDRYDDARDSLQQSIQSYSESGNTAGLAKAHGNLGSVFELQGRYSPALNSYRKALSFAETGKEVNRALIAGLRTDIGLVLSELGEHDAALRELDAALVLVKESPNPSLEARVLHNMGFAYFGRKKGNDVQRSVDVYRRVLELRRQASDRAGEPKTLNNLGFSYAELGQYTQAEEALKKALEISQQRRDRATEGRTLDSLGTLYMKMGNDTDALEQFHAALVVEREIGDRGLEHITLANIGRIYAKQQNRPLATTFLKQAVNVIEQIRGELGTLPKSARETYANSVADTYRLLADLLLQDHRILEAERVIDLLRVEELDEYLDGVRGDGASIYLLPSEEDIWAKYREALERGIAVARELAKLKQIEGANRTPGQTERINQLREERGRIKKAFQDFAKSREVEAAFRKQSLEVRNQSIELRSLLKLSMRLGRKAALLYTLILPERLELVVATADALPVHIPVDVSETKVEETILAFRSALISRSDSVKAPAKQLYEWLIGPLENAFAAADIDTIVYIPDGQLRYIPLAALYDGKDWLARRYRVNLITSQSTIDFGHVAPVMTKILAGAFTTDRVEVDVQDGHLVFDGLPFARKEVEDLVALYAAGAKSFYDRDFAPANVVGAFEDYQIVHLATHGHFAPGRPSEDSFILFGNGERMNLSDVSGSWVFDGVELVVLSACETGIGGRLGNGEEIHGFGYLMQDAGAKAVIASLWKVSDGGTQALMRAFYRYLKEKRASKSEALRQAQLTLIGGQENSASSTNGRGAFAVDGSAGGGSSGYSHPYHWAAFVLIGSGL